eukprot:7330392-Pyramimonas_sp.AAC.1
MSPCTANTSPNIRPHAIQEGPKSCPGQPTRAPMRPKRVNARRGLKAPQWSCQVAPKKPAHTPTTASQEGPETSQEVHKQPQVTPKTAQNDIQNGPIGAHLESQMAQTF